MKDKVLRKKLGFTGYTFNTDGQIRELEHGIAGVYSRLQELEQYLQIKWDKQPRGYSKIIKPPEQEGQKQ